MGAIAAYDPDGFFLAALSPACADRALARREAQRVPGRRDAIRLRASAAATGFRSLTPEEKRAIELRKQRARS